MANEKPPTVVVRRNRDNKIPDPDSHPTLRKEQNAKQRAQAKKVLESQVHQHEVDRAAARKAAAAERESDIMGVLSGRAAEIPIVKRNGRKAKLDLAAIAAGEGDGELQEKRASRKAAGKTAGGSRAARARGRSR
jgi:regulator of protease activity HflC (stomatin/prohibitin superfamily)